MSRFAHFVAIDWSGAAGNGTRALPWRNVAPDRAPTLVRPGHRWSRAEVLHWLRHDLPRDSLVGMDLGQSLPFVDCGAFFPDWAESPPDARALWAMVDAACTDEPHLGVNRFVDASEPARHFRRHGGRCGDRFPAARSPARNRARAGGDGLQALQQFQPGRRGASGQVEPFGDARAAPPCGPPARLADRSPACFGQRGLRNLHHHRRHGRRPPAQPLQDPRRHRTRHRAGALASAPFHTGAIDDHQSDALITAAWLRTVAAEPRLWHPPGLTPEIARTEGWTFGAS
jgi:hypothetical protein